MHISNTKMLVAILLVLFPVCLGVDEMVYCVAFVFLIENKQKCQL